MASESAPADGEGAVIDQGLWPTGIPPAPPQELDRYLDAAARCFARFGVSRTRMRDVAAEAGVSRVTMYRQVGGLEETMRLLLARDMHRLIRTLPNAMRGAVGPLAVVRLVETVVDRTRGHRVLAKVLNDEPELLNRVLVRDLGTVTAQATDVIAPMLEALMVDEQVARRDPRVLAEWLVRQTVTLIVAPARGDLSTFLAELLVPALAPIGDRR